ncbi:hypothetical protein EC968_007503 [Mortierella alpina]|nr:hypothetical protein EC968_007503 [Mortierella alpina]
MNAPTAAPLPATASGAPVFLSSTDHTTASQKRRSRSKSMAQSNQERPHIPSLLQQQNAPLIRKQMQEGLQTASTHDIIPQHEDQKGTTESRHNRAASSTQAGPTMPARQEIYPNRTESVGEQTETLASSVQDMKSLIFGGSTDLIRTPSKIIQTAKSNQIKDTLAPSHAEPESSPAEKLFTPAVTCRYPEKDWDDAEVFPPHLHLSESEIEYVKAIKTKITREKRLLTELRDQLRMERTLGRKIRLDELKREIIDSEENLSLLEDQMKPWRSLFIEAEDAWIPRCVGLVSTIPYHYLLRDWLLAVVVACSGGVEHPGMSLTSLRLESYVKNIIHDVKVPPFGKTEIGITINNRLIYASRPALNSVPIVKNFSLFPLFRCLSAEDIVTIMEVGALDFSLPDEVMKFSLGLQGVYIPILPAALMTCLQAPVPYIIGVERSCCDSDFPPEDACVVDLDKGTINVQLTRTLLPPRPRRKLVQSLQQYAPFCLAHGATTSAPVRDSTLGPPEYVKEAFPHSRLTLFCGVSRAPRWNKRSELRPPAPSTVSTITTASSAQGSSPTISRKSSSNTLSQSGPNHNLLPKIPKVDFERETLLQGSLIASDFEDRNLTGTTILGQGNLIIEADSAKTHVLTEEPKPPKPSKAVVDQVVPDSVNIATRKTLSPQRAKANLLELPKKADTVASNALQQAVQPQQLMPASGAIVKPGMNRSNSSQNIYWMSSSDASAGGLGHRASLTSLESSASSVFPKSTSTAVSQGSAHTGSPSTVTSHTMGSINGSSLASTRLTSPSMSSLPPFSHTSDSGRSHGGGIEFVEEEVEEEPDLSVPVSKEGHLLSSVSRPVPVSLLNYRCGICSHGLMAHQQVYRCERCSLFVHAGCMEELLYPCVPRGFDESGICWSVLQMWAGLLKGYRSGIIAGQMFQPPPYPQFPSTMHTQGQGHSPRGYGHTKQLSSSGSEGEKESRDRLSWATIRGWTSRSGNVTTGPNIRSTGAFSPTMNRASASVDQLNLQQQQQQQPYTRARSGTTGSTQSDTVRFHRDVFLKSVEKEAKPFMSSFTESQAFVQFVQDRVDRSPGDPEIMFFDEVIKAKINRSKFRLGKEETKFLDYCASRYLLYVV